MSLNFETESETKILWVSILRPSPRLDLSESQYRDRVRDWNYLSLSLETESETIELVETETDTESLAILCLLSIHDLQVAQCKQQAKGETLVKSVQIGEKNFSSERL